MAVDEEIINPFEVAFQNPGSDRRLMILGVAERIFSSKGYKETTISEIAADVGIKDSVIYRYFKGKQDVLFSVAEERLKEGVALLDRDLQGLNDPISRVRKMMWGNLWYHHHYSSYSRIFLFECLSSPKFYTSPTFAVLEKYVSRLTGILEQGIRENKFRNDIPIPLMQDVIFGTSNMTVIGFHHLGEPSNPVSDFEDIAFLVDSVIAAKPLAERGNVDKTSMILEAAEKVFAKRSLDTAKMSEIAKLAGVADGTLYEYFDNKHALLFSLPKMRFKEYNHDLSDLFYSDSLTRKLRRLIKYHFLNFLIDPYFMRIFVLNLFLNRDFYNSEAFEDYRSYYSLFESIIEQGQDAGTFRSEINPRIFRNMLIGTFSQMATRWLLNPETTELDMLKEIDIVTGRLSEAVLAI